VADANAACELGNVLAAAKDITHHAIVLTERQAATVFSDDASGILPPVLKGEQPFVEVWHRESPFLAQDGNYATHDDD
jgi:hypothetical protein